MTATLPVHPVVLCGAGPGDPGDALACVMAVTPRGVLPGRARLK